MSGRLVHTGQVIVDLVMRVDALPEAGGDVLASETALLPGGGFNVLAAAARAGARVHYAGAHGTGRFGEQARAALRQEGITVAQPPTEEMDTGVCVVLVGSDGERTFVTGSGAETRLTSAQLAAVEVSSDDVLYISGYSLMHESNRAALLGWLPGVSVATTLFDPGPLSGEIPRDILELALSKVDILSCNAREARALTGIGDSTAAATALATRLRRDAMVLVRAGASGCVLARSGGTQVIAGFPVTPVDTNGAGDTHCGVLAAALLHGAEPAVAAERANAAASLSVLHPGPATAPTGPEIDAFLARRAQPWLDGQP